MDTSSLKINHLFFTLCVGFIVPFYRSQSHDSCQSEETAPSQLSSFCPISFISLSDLELGDIVVRPSWSFLHWSVQWLSLSPSLCCYGFFFLYFHLIGISSVVGGVAERGWNRTTKQIGVLHVPPWTGSPNKDGQNVQTQKKKKRCKLLVIGVFGM